MHQVNEAELVWNVRYQIGQLGAALRKDLASSKPQVRRSAEQRIAEQIVRNALGRFEVLTSQEPPANMPEGTDLYSTAAYRP